jgi:hypothetical protein
LEWRGELRVKCVQTKGEVKVKSRQNLRSVARADVEARREPMTKAEGGVREGEGAVRKEGNCTHPRGMARHNSSASVILPPTAIPARINTTSSCEVARMLKGTDSLLVVRSSCVVLAWVVRGIGTIASHAILVRACKPSGVGFADAVAPRRLALDLVIGTAAEAHLEI